MRSWLVVLAATAAGLILGHIGLNEYLSQHPAAGFGRSWTDVLFYDLQLFVLNSAPAQGVGPFPVALGIARFLAPAATIAATLEGVRVLFIERAPLWASASASKHAVVAGDGPIVVELARKLRTEYRTVVLVTVTAATPEQVGRQRLLRVHGDPTDPGTLRAAGARRADVLYACSELSITNAATVLAARDISHAHGRRLVAFAQVRDMEIYTALRAMHIGTGDDPKLRLDFFAIEDIAARALLGKHPLAPNGSRAAQVVIVGFGLLGQAVLREIARHPNPDGARMSVRIRRASTEAISSFLDLFPVVRRNCSVSCDDAPQRPSGDEPALVFICLPDNEDALNVGLVASHAMTSRSDRVVICMSEPSPYVLGEVFSSRQALLDPEGRLAVFQVIKEGCVPGRIREDVADGLARAIHAAYVNNCVARGDSPARNPSMRPWEDLPDDLKQSNLAQAAQIGTKLDAIDCAVVPESAIVPAFAFSEAEIEKLAEMEHRRWVQERRGRGFLYGPNRDAKHHPDLVDWQHLSEGARDKDRDAIRSIPAILGQAGFQILRLPPPR
jgi:TrkA-N domain/RyR domain